MMRLRAIDCGGDEKKAIAACTRLCIQNRATHRWKVPRRGPYTTVSLATRATG